MGREERCGETFRDPYPGLLERLLWLWVRYATYRDVPRKSWVQLICPVTGWVTATEHTAPVAVEPGSEDGMDVYTYTCAACGETHSWLWGPPAPARMETDDE